MARRRKPLYDGALPKEAFEHAKNKLVALRAAVARATVDFPYSIEEILGWLFPSEISDVLRQAKPLIDAGYVIPAVDYPICPLVYPNVTLFVQPFTSTPFLLPSQTYLTTHNIPELDAVVAQLAVIVEQFAVAAFVLEWCNANCTMGALRYHWPAFMTLVPAGVAAKYSETPGHFREPRENIAPMLPLIRASATTLAATKFLPAPADHVHGYRIDFNQGYDYFEYEGVKVPCQKAYFGF